MPGLKTCPQFQSSATAPKRCSRCRSIAYCNRDCQEAHWKAHKKDCARLAQDEGLGGEEQAQTRDSREKPFTAINNNTFLRDRPEEEMFRIMTDLLRMRQEDEYVFEGNTLLGSIYDLDSTPESAFRGFVQAAARVPDFLPPWWTDEKLEQCLEYARTSAGSSLAAAIENGDVIKKWGDDRMPMKLRMMGERIYGNTPGGSQSGPMLGVMMAQENGTGPQFSAGIDLSALLSGRR